MNHATLRKIAASTAVICSANKGSVGAFFLIKALYLADRQMLADYGVPITGDSYSSMPKGPILCATYDLLKGAYWDKKFQAEWNAAFSRNGNDVSPKAKIDTDCLSQAEEEILAEKIRFILDLDRKGISVADWMHKNCPEWEDVKAGSSKPLPLTRILEKSNGLDATKAKEVKSRIDEALLTRDQSALSGSSLVLA